MVGEPHIRFYACIPLVTDEGHALGTLAVMDTRSRGLAAEELQTLQMLARQTMDQLELRRQKLQLSMALQEREQMRAALQAQNNVLQAAGRVARLGGWVMELPSRAFTLSSGIASTFGMRRAEESTSEDRPATYALDEVLKAFQPPFHERMQQAFDTCIQTGRDLDEVAEVPLPQGQRLWVRTSGHAVRDEAGRIVRVEGAFQDISAQHQAEMQAQRNAQHHAELLQVQQQISSLDMALPDALRLVAHTVQKQTAARGAMIELLEAEQLVAKASVGDMVRPEGQPAVGARQHLVACAAPRPHGVVQRHPGGGLGHGLHAAPLGRSLGDGHTAARGQPHRGQPQGHLRPARCLFAQRCEPAGNTHRITRHHGTTAACDQPA